MEISHMKKRALIVGINYPGTANQLKGCINDAHHMQAFLAERGFTDIKLLLDAEATTVAIKQHLNDLVADVVPGDVIVFHYSGHGSQLPSKVEQDGFEEIICPVDLNWMDKVITDVTLRDIFNKVPNGVNTTVILDCCHSGTMLNQTESLSDTKEMSAPKKIKGARYLKPPAKILRSLSDRKLVDWQTSRDVNASALLIAGCKAHQTSADAFINNIPQGAATAALLAAVKANPTISYRTLITSMNNYMVKGRYTQQPQLDGSSSLYDKTFIEPFTTIDITTSGDTSTEAVTEVVTPVVTPLTTKTNNTKMFVIAIAIIIAIIVISL